MSRIISVCCVLGLAAPLAVIQAPASWADSGCLPPEPFASGDGLSAATAYEIATPAQLQYLRETSTIWDDSLYFAVTSDIDLTGCAWTGGIGQPALNANGFTGSIDGKGHVISGMNIVSTTATRVGLIAYQAAGSIEDLGVQGTITVNAVAPGSANNEVGGLVGGSTSTGAIQRSFADVDIAVNASSTESCSYMFTPPLCSSSVSVYAGGLLGYSDSINISDSYARGDVSVTSSAAGSSGYSTLFIGGLIGALYYKTVTNSYSTGEPTAVVTLGSSNIRLGGFSGFAGGNAGVFVATPGSVWDTTTSNTSTGLGLNQGSTVLPTGKTTAEMTSISTYPAWSIATAYDASKTWILCPTVNNGYPAFMLSQPVGACSPPTVSSVSPAVGTTAGGTQVTISGTSLANATSVTIGGSAATVTANSDTTITATAPAGTAGTVDIVVTTGNGSDTLAGAFTYVSPQVDTGGGNSNSSSGSQSTASAVSPTPTVPSPAPSVSEAVMPAEPPSARPTTTRRAFVLFGMGSAELIPSAKRKLDSIIVAARGKEPQTVIVGAVRAIGATSADRRLALRRALNVADHLRGNGMPGRIRVGESAPTTLTTREARRVDITVRY